MGEAWLEINGGIEQSELRLKQRGNPPRET